MRNVVVFGLALFVVVGCSKLSPDKPASVDEPDPNAVLRVGDVFEFRNGNGTMTISADSNRKRTYSWDGASRSVEMESRKQPWYGALGLYFPGPGDHWAEHNGITRGVLQEQTRDFATSDEFMAWFKDRQEWYDARCSPNGIVAGWSIELSRNQLNVELWRVTIAGKPPVGLKDASSDWFTWTKAGR